MNCPPVAIAAVIGVAIAAHLVGALASVFSRIGTTTYQLLAGVLS